MSLGTLYVQDGTIRPILSDLLVRHYNLDIKLIDTKEAGPEYAEQFPLKLVPAFIGRNTYKLTESIPVNIYLLGLAGDKQYLGNNDEESASILQWMSFINGDMFPPMHDAFMAILEAGGYQYDEQLVKKNLRLFDKLAAVLEAHLTKSRYLVGNRITLADLYGVSILIYGFKLLFGAQWRRQHPAVTDWYDKIINHEIFAEKYGNFQHISEPIKHKSQ
jgi:elongation factor 1-gamma